MNGVYRIRYGPGLDGADVGKRNICIIQAVDRQGEDLKTGGLIFDSKVSTRMDNIICLTIHRSRDLRER